MIGPGTVSLVGAGPGDPELITRRGYERLCSADVVVYDRLIDPRVLDAVPGHAECIFAGKAAGSAALDQRAIEDVLIDRARRGKRVVRLKGGDPFVFGRGGEEVEALARAGIRYEVVPGVSSALAAPAAAGIPVTHRELASSVTIVTGHEADVKERRGFPSQSISARGVVGAVPCACPPGRSTTVAPPSEHASPQPIPGGTESGQMDASARTGIAGGGTPGGRGLRNAPRTIHREEHLADEPGIDWDWLAHAPGTLVVLMGLERVEDICARLIAAGRDSRTPAAAVASGTLPAQQTVRSTLDRLAAAVAQAELCSPAVIVIGKVADFPAVLASTGLLRAV
ncbi:MAG TPA: uroporphyrinogen-III C-methyltransferase [Chloroflexota bacterium]|nr:uroporphyrinogen-III C-methyltransferase [Chloroflexota bacterium]